MLCTFYIWQIDGGFRAVVDASLADAVIKRLRMYVLRAKVVVAERAEPLYFHPSSQAALSHDGAQYAVLAGYALSETMSVLGALSDWTLAHIQAGVAWISATSSEQFVPQATNYELVGGVNFQKGCYPGQEVVARSQYLGKLKRRAAIGIMASTGAESVPVMADIDAAGEPQPVGSVILAQGNWLLFECPQGRLGDRLSCLGRAISVQPLPYEIVDITA